MLIQLQHSRIHTIQSNFLSFKAKLLKAKMFYKISTFHFFIWYNLFGRTHSIFPAEFSRWVIRRWNQWSYMIISIHSPIACSSWCFSWTTSWINRIIEFVKRAPVIILFHLIFMLRIGHSDNVIVKRNIFILKKSVLDGLGPVKLNVFKYSLKNLHEMFLSLYNSLCF